MVGREKAASSNPSQETDTRYKMLGSAPTAQDPGLYRCHRRKRATLRSGISRGRGHPHHPIWSHGLLQDQLPTALHSGDRGLAETRRPCLQGFPGLLESDVLGQWSLDLLTSKGPNTFLMRVNLWGKHVKLAAHNEYVFGPANITSEQLLQL